MTVSPFRSDWLPACLTVVIALVINLAPLALGSNRALPWAYNGLACGVLLLMTIIWSIAAAASDRQVSLRFIAGPLLLFALVLVWAAIQAVPIAPGNLANPVWQLAGDIDPSIGNRSISVNPENSLFSVMRLLTYGSVFLSVYLLSGKPERAAVFMRFFVCFTCLYAVYGLFRFAADWNKILWFTSQSRHLTGPFISQNSAATYFGMGLVVSVAMVLKTFWRRDAETRHSSARYRLLAIFGLFSGRGGLLVALSFILLVALILTTSRAGIAATFAGCLTLAVLGFVKRRSGQRGATGFTGLAVISILIVVVLEMSGSTLSERILTSDVDFGGRLDVYRMTLTAIFDNAWAGTGIGTFQDMFPVFRDDILTHGLIWDKAHNDYLELFLGLGIPAAMIFLSVLVYLSGWVLRGYFRRRRNSIYCGIAVSVSVIAGLHSLLDFSMQIQAVAMAYAMLLALGVAQCRSSRSSVKA